MLNNTGQLYNKFIQLLTEFRERPPLEQNVTKVKFFSYFLAGIFCDEMLLAPSRNNNRFNTKETASSGECCKTLI